MLGESTTSGVFNVASAQSKPLSEYVLQISENILFGDEKSTVNLNVSIEELLTAIGKWETEDFKTVILGGNQWQKLVIC
ncbi:MAG: hypothetical protein K2O91_14780 [Lachnospiraceae bacterium]|nr:hypothetical protein [Lachnospiraceae bacterium]